MRLRISRMALIGATRGTASKPAISPEREIDPPRVIGGASERRRAESSGRLATVAAIGLLLSLWLRPAARSEQPSLGVRADSFEPVPRHLVRPPRHWRRGFPGRTRDWNDVCSVDPGSVSAMPFQGGEIMVRGLGGISPANVQHHLKGVHYPATKEALVEQARKNQAPPEVLEMIEHMPEQEYGGPQDVMKGYGQAREESGQ
jgi:hypothetical protein